MTETSTVADRNSRSSMIWGILMIISGVLAICLPLASSIGLAILVGWLLLVSAVWHLIFVFRSRDLGGSLWQLVLAIVYGAVGLLVLFNPLAGVISFTLLLAIFLLLEAALELAIYFTVRRTTNAGWVLLDSVITLILAMLIWVHWPSSSVWAIGTLMGVSLIFSGISRLMLSSGVRRNPVNG